MNLRNIDELRNTLQARFEKHGIRVTDSDLYPGGRWFDMTLIFDNGRLTLNYTVEKEFGVMDAGIRHSYEFNESFLFSTLRCAYTGRFVYESYGFHIRNTYDMNRFIKWVIEEVKPKLTD